MLDNHSGRFVFLSLLFGMTPQMGGLNIIGQQNTFNILYLWIIFGKADILKQLPI